MSKVALYSPVYPTFRNVLKKNFTVRRLTVYGAEKGPQNRASPYRGGGRGLGGCMCMQASSSIVSREITGINAGIGICIVAIKAPPLTRHGAITG